jgi:hypothetical protein
MLWSSGEKGRGEEGPFIRGVRVRWRREEGRKREKEGTVCASPTRRRKGSYQNFNFQSSGKGSRRLIRCLTDSLDVLKGSEQNESFYTYLFEQQSIWWTSYLLIHINQPTGLIGFRLHNQPVDLNKHLVGPTRLLIKVLVLQNSADLTTPSPYHFSLG